MHGNPGGGQLALDPYAGHIADTAGPLSPAEDAGTGEPAPPPPAVFDPPARLVDLPQRWRRHGTAELSRRMLARLGREIAARMPRRRAAAPAAPALTDERTVAQLRAMSHLLGHLDSAAERRRAVQQRRRRPDREYFERFPPYLVPTYPGDADLFASPGFRTWLPAEPQLVEARLADVMEMNG